MRFAGIKDNRITIIYDRKFINDSITCEEIPNELSDVSSKELIVNYRYQNGSFICKDDKKSRNKLKIAIVSNFKQQCGISTYIESLLPHISPQVGEYKLFIESSDNITGDLFELQGLKLPVGSVEACWKRGEELSGLIKAIKLYSPDIIWFQHEYGLWSHAGRWLAMMTQLSTYRVIVTLHSVFHHKDKTIIEASIPEIIVHLEGARNVLKDEKKIGGKVYVIPHGCNESSPGRLWNFYKSNETFIQMGFGFRYKKFEDSIRATAILKKKYPNVFFTALFSRSPFNQIEHEMYRQELLNLIEELDVQENVAIVDGFQSDETIDSFLRTNQVAVFPYGMDPLHEVFGASGASRLAMTTSMPIITSSIPHFSDMPTVKTFDVESLANAIDVMFSNKVAKDLQITAQNDWLMNNSWKMIAEKHLKLFEE